MRVTRRKLHIDFLLEFTIKKNIFDIHLIEWPFASRRNDNKSPDRRKSSHMSKSLLIINPILMSKTLGNKASLVVISSAI